MITMTTSIDTSTLFVVQTGEAFGVRQGNAGEDAPEGYVSRSALKAVVRAVLNAEGGPVVVTPEVASAAGRENLRLMSVAGQAGAASAMISMAGSLLSEAASVLGSDIDVDQAIAVINSQGQGEDESDEEDTEPDF